MLTADTGANPDHAEIDGPSVRDVADVDETSPAGLVEDDRTVRLHLRQNVPVQVALQQLEYAGCGSNARTRPAGPTASPMAIANTPMFAPTSTTTSPCLSRPW